ncbi:hypothetical protein CBR_g34170 [Chara braunii]|uniref:Conserved oligomeric Golgi complex subunit 8 n=1 Tax=Chara braunii TaxID=69332 RepID=A0A388LI40_CHABU|nr:hypothetical protein CBR_g34170 [Chara braunii]|eukprot:GBG81990.1 hypothetical protein CBR_g34170 [Chara braunii]
MASVATALAVDLGGYRFDGLEDFHGDPPLADGDGGINDLSEDGVQDAYLSELLSYSLERLNKEPELLRADADRIRRQMQEVAVSNYGAFITAAESIQAIRKEIAAVDAHLETLVNEVPKLTTGCNEFMEKAQHILEKRSLNNTMLANHNTLLELLKIPQLMDTCVRNGNYDEALDLEAFVAKLATMHSRLPVIQTLADEVHQITQAMLQQLLQRLRSSIQLPDCLRVIGYLRRLAVFGEHEMRLQFLRCREAWLADIIEELDQSSPYDYLKRITECHRVHLFDVVMHYRAIFSDDTSGQEEVNDGGLVYSWAMHRVTAYLNVLRTMLPRISEGTSLESILQHCMYCAMSLGRVGLDFRGLLPPLFESCVYDLFNRNISVAVEAFQHALASHRWVPLPPMGSSRLSGADDGSEDVAPPYSLMEHPPLAAFVNGVLAALNELRHCAPLSLRSSLAGTLQQALKNVTDTLLRFNATRILRDSEKSLFMGLCRAFVEIAAPYCAVCFGRCYSGGASLLDTRTVLEPVRKLVMLSSAAPDAGPSARNEVQADDPANRDTGGGERDDIDEDNDLDVDPSTINLDNVYDEEEGDERAGGDSATEGDDDTTTWLNGKHSGKPEGARVSSPVKVSVSKCGAQPTVVTDSSPPDVR